MRILDNEATPACRSILLRRLPACSAFPRGPGAQRQPLSAESHQIRLLEDFWGVAAAAPGSPAVPDAPGETLFSEGISAGWPDSPEQRAAARGGEMRAASCLQPVCGEVADPSGWPGCASFIPSWISAWRWWRGRPRTLSDGWRTASSPSPEGPGYPARSAYRERLMPVCSRRLWQQVEGEWPAAPGSCRCSSRPFTGAGRIGGAGRGGGLTHSRGEDAPLQPHSAGAGGGPGIRGGVHQRLHVAAGRSPAWYDCRCTPRDRRQLSISSASGSAPMNPPSAGLRQWLMRRRARASLEARGKRASGRV